MTGADHALPELADFSATRAPARHALLACVVGAAVAVVAPGLLDLIAALTHLLHSGTLSVRAVSPSTATLGVCIA